jgi:hypothetical protein
MSNATMSIFEKWVLHIRLIRKSHLSLQLIPSSLIHIRQNPLVLFIKVVTMPAQEQDDEA